MTSIQSMQWSGPARLRILRSRLLLPGLVSMVSMLGACALVPEPAPLAPAYQRVGVVSLTAGQLTQREADDRARVTKRNVRDISSWQIDRAYEEQLASAVQAVLGVAAVKSTGPAPSLAALNDAANPYVQPGFWAYRTDPLAASLRDYCADNRLDVLVVATQSKDEDVLGGTYDALAGAGIYGRSNGPLVHLSAGLRLVDCETGRTLAHRHVASSRSFSASHGYPVRPLPASLAGKPLAQWTRDDDQQLRQFLIALPADAWTDTLEEIFHPGRPPVPARALMPNT